MATSSKMSHFDTNTVDKASNEALTGPGDGKVLFENQRVRIHDIRVSSGQKKESHFSAPETIVWKVLPNESEPTPLPVAYPPGSSTALSPGRFFVFEVLADKPKYSEKEINELLSAPSFASDVGSVSQHASLSLSLSLFLSLSLKPCLRHTCASATGSLHGNGLDSLLGIYVEERR